MGNVLVYFNPDISINKYCKTEEEKEIIKKALFGGKEWLMGDAGEISNKDLFEKVKHKVPENYYESLKNCAENWNICTTPLKGAKEFCNYVKNKGYGIYVLSNASDKFYDYFPNFLPLDFFNGIVLSSDIHILKPNEDIFKYILNKYNLKEEECLFIDDKDYNIEAAKKLNFKAEVFQENFDEIIKKYDL